MSKLVARSCCFIGLYKGLFDFRSDFDQTFCHNLFIWPFS